ncbi:MAG: carbohydrate ABC transporter permease [Anaerolineae bacterium]
MATSVLSRPRFAQRRLLEQLWLIFLQLLMTALLISFLVPTLWMVSASLKASTEIFQHPITWIPRDPQWSNYVRVFQVIPLAKFAENTVIVVALAVAGTLVSSVMVAYAFARIRWPGRDFFFSLLIATMMLPEVVTLIPRFIIFKYLGWLDTWLPLIVPYWCANTALYVFLIQQFFRGIPMELEEAALIDGAGRIRILTEILLPLCKPVAATVAVFALLQHYNSFLEPLIYLNSMDKWTLALGIRAINDSNAANWELVFAAGTVMVAPIVALFLVAQRYFVQGIAMTGFGGR